MKSFSERLWPAFLAEVSEQLEALELLLVRRAGASADELNAMFRHFHTIKGGCAMMGFANMGALAHAAEDALDPVRRGERVLDEALIDVLLKSTDALRQQLQDASATQQDPAPREALVRQLREAIAVSTPSAGAAAVKSRPVSSAPDSAEVPLDNNTRAGEFARVARHLLPAIEDGVLQPGKVPLPAGEALGELALAAVAMRLPAIARLLERLHQALGDPRRRLLRLGEACERMVDLEQEAGVDCGLSNRVRTASLVVRFNAALDAVATALERREVVAALARTEELLALCRILVLPHSAQLCQLAAQVLRDEIYRGMVAHPELDDALMLVARLPGELQEGLVEDEPYSAMCAALRERLQQAMGAAAGSAEQAALQARVREQVDVHEGLLGGLSTPALERLLAALARGDTLVEIEAAMEQAADNGAAFVAWLDAQGGQIGNQTIFHREQTGESESEATSLRFLAALSLSLPEIRAALGRLDPEKRLFTLRACAPQQSPSPGPVVAAAADDGGSAPAPAVAVPAGTATPAAGLQTLRIDSSAVDQFVNRVGELVTLRNMMAHALQEDEVAARQRRLQARLQSASGDAVSMDVGEVRQLLADLERRQENLLQTDLRMQGALARIQEDVLALRVVPVANVFNRLPRVVRDLAQAQRKSVELVMVDEDVRVDKSLVDVLIEPLMHLVRNAVDHGLETPAQRRSAGKPEQATLTLAAKQQGGSLLIEISDDGRGLDLARIRQRAREAGLMSAAALAGLGERELAALIFLPGFSTAETVTEVSGRGVGMDVVKTRIAQAGGQVDVRTRAGQGTTFILRLPLSVAIQSVIQVLAGRHEMAIPERHVEEIISVPVGALQSVQGQACCVLRGGMLPVYALAGLLGHAPAAPAPAAPALAEILVLGDGVHRMGLRVDRVVGRPEVFVRDVHADIARLPAVGGVSILGNGQVVIILDCEKLFALALDNAQSLRALVQAS